MNFTSVKKNGKLLSAVSSSASTTKKSKALTAPVLCDGKESSGILFYWVLDTESRPILVVNADLVDPEVLRNCVRAKIDLLYSGLLMVHEISAQHLHDIGFGAYEGCGDFLKLPPWSRRFPDMTAIALGRNKQVRGRALALSLLLNACITPASPIPKSCLTCYHASFPNLIEQAESLM